MLLFPPPPSVRCLLPRHSSQILTCNASFSSCSSSSSSSVLLVLRLRGSGLEVRSITGIGGGGLTTKDEGIVMRCGEHEAHTTRPHFLLSPYQHEDAVSRTIQFESPTGSGAVG
jgi:hypothetical protein